MGVNTEEKRMKIIDTTLFKPTQTVRAQRTCDSNFETLITTTSNGILEKAKTQSNRWHQERNWQALGLCQEGSSKELCAKQTGEEYYWTHQQQLQQSALSFEPQPVKKQQHPQSITPDKEKRTSEKTTSTPQAQALQTKSDDSKIRPHSIATPTASVPKEAWGVGITLAKTSTTKGLEQPIRSNQNPVVKGLTSNPLDLPKPRDFNKHHLFIQGSEAELTLNTNELSPKEEKELIQLIQNHLKLKGLALSRLVINGATP